MKSLAIGLAALLVGAAPAAAQQATLKSFAGECEMKTGGAAKFVAAVLGAKLKTGDFIATGLRSSAVLAFEDNSEVKVAAITQLRIDEFLSQANRARTQIFLRVGSIEAKVKHTAAIRSDFSVVTPTCTASVRGSAERVTYMPGFGTTVEYLEGLGLAESAAGQRVSLHANDTAKSSSTGHLSNPSECAKEAVVTDLTPSGTTAGEKAGITDYGRLAVRPDTDPSNPLNSVFNANEGIRNTRLIFRYSFDQKIPPVTGR